MKIRCIRQRTVRTLYYGTALALALFFSCGRFLAQQSEQNPIPLMISYATVHGIVLNAATHRPLPRALVRIEGNAATGALTDGEGRFEIHGIPAGQQLFQITKPGYLDRALDIQALFSDGGAFAHNVLVTTQMPELVFSLVPSSAIQGHVDLSTDEPAEGIVITLLRQTVDNGRSLWTMNGTTRTNSEGHYRFSGLGAGIYVLYTSPTMDSGAASPLVELGPNDQVMRQGYPSVYYPAGRDLATAARIQLKIGEQASANIDLTLEPYRTIPVKVGLPGGLAEPGGASGRDINGSLQNINASITDAAGHLLAYSAQYDPTAGMIQADLPDGNYTLSLSATMRKPSGDGATTADLLIGSLELTLDGHPLRNQRLSLIPMQPVAIHLRLPDSFVRKQETRNSRTAAQAALSPVNAFFTPIDGLSQTLAFTSLSKSAFNTLEFLPVASGAFWANTLPTQPGVCIGSFIMGSTDLAVDPLVLNAASSPAAIELTVRDDCASLNLELPNTVALLPGIEPSFTVYVLPDFDTTASGMPYTLRPSSGGTLTAENLTPGNYHVYTFTGPVELEYHNPAAMAALVGQAITLAPAASSNLVLELPAQ